MAQVEQPANLARQDNPACRLITLILIRCGLRISSAAGLAFDCTVTDADGAPYLRYYNHQDETRGPRPHRRRALPR